MRRPVTFTHAALGAVVASCLVAVLAFAAVPAGATVDRATAVSPGRWSTSVCTSIGRWQQQLGRLGFTDTLTDPTVGKGAITKVLDGAVRATTKLGKDLRSAGVPAGPNGKAIAVSFISAVKTLSGAYAKAKIDTSAASTDPAAFALEVRALATQLQTAGSTFTGALAQAATQYPNAALDKAFSSAKSCKAIA